jgi:hypothetical protein
MTLQMLRDRLNNGQEEKQAYNTKQRQITATPSPARSTTEQMGPDEGIKERTQYVNDTR